MGIFFLNLFINYKESHTELFPLIYYCDAG